MDKWLDLLVPAFGGGIITGLIAWGAMRADIKWMKEGMSELKTDLRSLRELVIRHITDCHNYPLSDEDKRD